MLPALEQIRRMRGGAQSHLMRCDDGYYYVVKFQNNPQHRRILVNEMLGTKLAARLGLPTVPVAIIEVSEELIRLTPELAMELPRARIPCQPGAQFGSRYPGVSGDWWKAPVSALRAPARSSFPVSLSLCGGTGGRSRRPPRGGRS